jgi:hypothetical protein
MRQRADDSSIRRLVKDNNKKERKGEEKRKMETEGEE